MSKGPKKRPAKDHTQHGTGRVIRESPATVTEGFPFVVEEGQALVIQAAETFSRPPDDHPIYSKIGRVVSDWSHVEHVLDLIIWELTGGDERAVAASTAQMNGAHPRAMAIISLLQVRGMLDAKLTSFIENFRGACSTTGNYRNRIVHDAWFVSDGETPVVGTFRSLPKEDRRFGIAEINDAYFEKVLGKIERRLNEARDLQRQISERLASHGKGQ